MSAMRVAMVCPYDMVARGGVQVQVEEMARQLTSMGLEVTVIAPGVTEYTPSIAVESRIVRAKGNDSVAPIALSPAAFRATRRAASLFDVLHVHEPLMPLVSLAATSMSVPRVLTFHAAPTTRVSSLYALTRPLLKRLFKSAVVTAVSTYAAAPVQEIVPVEIVPNAVGIDDFRPDAKTPFTVAYIGRDEPRKGLDVLLRAWPMVKQAAPEARLDVIGCSRPSPAPGVHFHGRAPEPDKRRILANAQVFCAPYLRGESFGTVLLEALASGCAIVASNLPAFRAVTAEHAQFVPPGEPEALAAALLSVMGEDRGPRMDAAAYVQRFDRAAIAARYVNLYAEAIEAAHAT